MVAPPVLVEEGPYFSGKPRARAAIWARFGHAEGSRPRAPQFAGAERAAERLLESPVFAAARAVLVDPDPAIRAVRRLALARGLVVYVPAPQLRAGFRGLGAARCRELGALSVDVVVPASVAVTRDGYHCGAGFGRMDLVYALLREHGHRAVPALTVVHSSQIVRYFPSYEHDLPLSAIATPEELITVPNPAPAPRRIEPARVSEEALARMPGLWRLRPG